MKALISLSSLLITVVLAAVPCRAEGAPTENLPSLVRTALANNPDLKSTEARWQMFTAKVKQASSLDDPMLMLKIQNGVVSDPLNFRKEPMTGKVIGISQQIPFWGKRDLKGEIADREAESYHWQLEERKLELARMVKETCYRIYDTDKALEIVAKNIRIMDEFVTIAETKYSVGQGTQQDVFKAQVERSRLLDLKINLEQQRKSLEAALNALLYRPAETPVGRIADFQLPSLPLSAPELRDMAYQKRPQIRSLDAQARKEEAVRKLAQKEFFPDFNVSLEYMQRDPAGGGDGADMYSLGVTFNLPVQRERRHAMVAEANSAGGMAGEEINSLKNSIAAGIADLLARMEKRRKLVQLYRSGIIPQAEQSLESAVIGYRVNKVDFLTLLDSRVTLFNYERELYDSMAEYMMRLAQLESLVGAELSDK